jgi:hypothetical protein
MQHSGIGLSMKSALPLALQLQWVVVNLMGVADINIWLLY